MKLSDCLDKIQNLQLDFKLLQLKTNKDGPKLQELTGSQINLDLVAPANPKDGKSNNYSFITNVKNLYCLSDSEVGLLICKDLGSNELIKIFNNRNLDKPDMLLLTTSNPYYVYSLFTQIINPLPNNVGELLDMSRLDSSNKIGKNTIISASANISIDCEIGDNCVIYPGVVLENGVKIGNNCYLKPNVVLGHRTKLGDNVIVGACSVIGSDGFGFAPYDFLSSSSDNNSNYSWSKIHHLGKVKIGNQVSIGANCVIDRGTIKDTIIEDNCIIDAQVHIAHNCKLGSGSCCISNVAIAGSTKVGKRNIIAGQTGFTGHIFTAADCKFMARTVVSKNVKQAGIYAGFPMQKLHNWQRNQVIGANLSKLKHDLKMEIKALRAEIKNSK